MGYSKTKEDSIKLSKEYPSITFVSELEGLVEVATLDKENKNI